MKSIKEFLNNWLPISIKEISDHCYVVEADTQADIYLWASAGVLNRTKCKSGVQFNLNVEGLYKGEIVEIKAGYKFWPNISKFKVVV
jgi:hypothetical protein